MKNDKKRITLLMALIIASCGVGSVVFAQDAAADADMVKSEVVSENVSAKVVKDDLEQSEPAIDDKTLKANKETFELAQEAFNKKDFQSAIDYITPYIEGKPKRYEAYKLRGEAYYGLRRYDLAQKDFERAIELKAGGDKFITGTKVLSAVILGAPKEDQYQNPELGNLYGLLMYSQKAQNLQSYEASYQKAVEYNSHIYLPTPVKADINRINCPQKYDKKHITEGVDKYIYDSIDDIAGGNFNEAVYKIQYITSNYPDYFMGYYLSGVALYGLEQYNDAIDAFNQALKLNPYDFESLASLGLIYYAKASEEFSSDLSQKSVEYFKKALKLNPNCGTYYYFIGLNGLLIDDYELAISNFDKAVKINSEDYNSRYYLAVSQYLNGDYNSVDEECSKLLVRHVSNYNSVLYLRALARYRMGQEDLALSDIEKIHNNMDDIYNRDLRVISNKEKTLTRYTYYLKAKILNDKGFGTKSDMEKALSNPIISQLSKINDKNKASITVNSPVLTLADIENQGDYIKTTFDNIGVGFVYTNPDYKLALSAPKAKLAEPSAKNSETLKALTEPEDTLLGENQSSIAQMLALNNINIVQPQKAETVLNSETPEISEPAAESAPVEAVENLAKPSETPEVTQVQDAPAEIAEDEAKVPVVDEIQTKTKEVPQIVEKHANVNLAEFNVPKPALKISPEDEVIEFKPDDIEMFKSPAARMPQPLAVILNSVQTQPEVPEAITSSAAKESAATAAAVEEAIAETATSAVEEVATEEEPEIIVKEIVVVGKTSAETKAVPAVEKEVSVTDDVASVIEKTAENSETAKEDVSQVQEEQAVEDIKEELKTEVQEELLLDEKQYKKNKKQRIKKEKPVKQKSPKIKQEKSVKEEEVKEPSESEIVIESIV